MRTSFSTAKTVPSKMGAVIIPVGLKGAIPAGVGLNRSELAAMGFEGKGAQTLVLPASARGSFRVLIGVGDVAQVTPNSLRTFAAATARVCARFESVAS